MLNIKKLMTKTLNSFVPKTGTFTKSQSASSSSIFVRQYGKVVSVNGYINGVTTTANAETQIGTLSNIGLPTEHIRALCSVGANGYSMGTPSYMSISVSGAVAVTSSNGGSGKAIYFNITYISA